MIVSARYVRPGDGYGGGRMPTVEGTTSCGRPYYPPVPVVREEGRLSGVNGIFWSNIPVSRSTSSPGGCVPSHCP